LLHIASDYLLHVITFVINSFEVFQRNSAICAEIADRCDFHRTVGKLTVHQKGIYPYGIKLYNNLPQQIKCSSPNSKEFKIALKEFF
jgi:hypothetical protein